MQKLTKMLEDVTVRFEEVTVRRPAGRLVTLAQVTVGGRHTAYATSAA